MMLNTCRIRFIVCLLFYACVLVGTVTVLPAAHATSAAQKTHVTDDASDDDTVGYDMGRRPSITVGKTFREMPILAQGRVKTIDSFARHYLSLFGGREEADDLSASAWLAELIFTPDLARDRAVFRIADMDLLRKINLKPQDDQSVYFSYNQIVSALESSRFGSSSLQKLIKESEQDDFKHADILSVYESIWIYSDLSRSLSIFMPVLMPVPDTVMERYFADVVAADRPLIFMDIKRQAARIQDDADRILDEKGENLETYTEDERAVMRLMLELQGATSRGLPVLYPAFDGKAFRVVPVAPLADADYDIRGATENFLSPWDVIQRGGINPNNKIFLEQWKIALYAYIIGNERLWRQAIERLYERSIVAAAEMDDGDILAVKAKFEIENLYNRVTPFRLAIGLMVGASLLMLTAAFYRTTERTTVTYKAGRLLGIGGYGVAVAAFLLMGLGTAIRIWIMGRPPVGTLYESLLFVALVLSFGVLVSTFLKRNLWVSAAGFMMVALLLLQSVVLSVGQDDFKVLEAVLNTNFWLATHVVFVTVGYGWCFLTSIAAHMTLIHAAVSPQGKAVWARDSIRQITFHALIALFFVAVGTVLGGIWADQSWGRFWGWDPKENGALLIVLWLVWLLHGRISHDLNRLYYLAGMAFVSVIVALSWFGVNLLSVGLHSYGFTSEVAYSLGGFTAFELLVIGGLVIWIEKKERNHASKI